jgi:hypothetical protein
VTHAAEVASDDMIPRGRKVGVMKQRWVNKHSEGEDSSIRYKIYRMSTIVQ